jgi:F-type H+-transporting ATPase subunit b
MVGLLAAESSNDLIKVVPGLMIWTLIAFAITFFVLKKFAFGPIQKTIDERRDRIRQAVEEADNARNEARELLEQNRAILAQARSESADILAEARKVGDAQIERAKQEAETERQRRMEETRRQIDAETARAIGQIRSEVADLTVEATERVVGKVLDTADQRRLVEEAVQGLDFSALEKGSTN